jgi:hypothetical protein
MAQAISHSSIKAGSVHIEFVADKVAICQNFLRVIRISPVTIIAQRLHTHVSCEG